MIRWWRDRKPHTRTFLKVVGAAGLIALVFLGFVVFRAIQTPGASTVSTNQHSLPAVTEPSHGDTATERALKPWEPWSGPDQAGSTARADNLLLLGPAASVQVSLWTLDFTPTANGWQQQDETSQTVITAMSIDHNEVSLQISGSSSVFKVSFGQPFMSRFNPAFVFAIDSSKTIWRMPTETAVQHKYKY